jgi:hypothetical protein
MDDKAGRGKWEGDFSRQSILPFKLAEAGMEGWRNKKTPHAAGFEIGGNGVADAAGIINHKVLNRAIFFPSPRWGISVNLRRLNHNFVKKINFLSF